MDKSSVKVSQQAHDGLLSPSSPPRRRTDHILNIIQSWWLELLLLVATVGAFAAIVAVTMTYQHRRLPDWPLHITINALIAIFTVIMRGSMLFIVAQTLSEQKWLWFEKPRALLDLARFDMASRGAWGSFLLIFGLRGRNIMATLAALITVLSLAVDPFAQEVVRYYSCQSPAAFTNATAPRTGFFQEMGKSRIGAGQNLATAGMQAAINAGIFAPSALRVPLDCPSGNCNFTTPYHSLGYCSSCTDRSDDLLIDVQANNRSTFPITNTSLPSGLEAINRGYNAATSFFTSGTGSKAGYEVILGAAASYETGELTEGINCTDAERQDATSSWRCRGYGAASCSLRPCIHSYTAEIRNGTAREVDIGTSEEWGSGFQLSPASVNVPCLTTEQRDALVAEKYPVDQNTTWLAYNRTIAPGTNGSFYGGAQSTADLSNRVTTDIVPPHCMYGFYSLSINSIDQYLDLLLNGSIIPYGSAFRSNTSPAIEAMYNDRNTSFAHIESLFQNISLAITSYIRQHGNETVYPGMNSSDISFAPNQAAYGIILEDGTCINVRWWWLIYPGVLVVLTTMVLLATIVASLQGADATGGVNPGTRVPLHSTTWKDSPLPLLYHGLERSIATHASTAAPVPIGALEKHAKSLRVQLGVGDEGLRLKQD